MIGAAASFAQHPGGAAGQQAKTAARWHHGSRAERATAAPAPAPAPPPDLLVSLPEGGGAAQGCGRPVLQPGRVPGQDAGHARRPRDVSVAQAAGLGGGRLQQQLPPAGAGEWGGGEAQHAAWPRGGWGRCNGSQLGSGLRASPLHAALHLCSGRLEAACCCHCCRCCCAAAPGARTLLGPGCPVGQRAAVSRARLAPGGRLPLEVCPLRRQPRAQKLQLQLLLLGAALPAGQQERGQGGCARGEAPEKAAGGPMSLSPVAAELVQLRPDAACVHSDDADPWVGWALQDGWSCSWCCFQLLILLRGGCEGGIWA
jgi:hypothetical protein